MGPAFAQQVLPERANAHAGKQTKATFGHQTTMIWSQEPYMLSHSLVPSLDMVRWYDSLVWFALTLLYHHLIWFLGMIWFQTNKRNDTYYSLIWFSYIIHWYILKPTSPDAPRSSVKYGTDHQGVKRLLTLKRKPSTSIERDTFSP